MKKYLLFYIILIGNISNTIAQNFDRAEAASKSVTGMTSNGGSKGYGLAYHYNPGTGKDSLLFNFTGAGRSIFLGNPEGNVIQVKNGRLYGMAPFGGSFNNGAIFSYNPTIGLDSIVFSFQPQYGTYAIGSLMQASNGLLYGMTTYGGKFGNGVLFSFNPGTAKDSVLVNFDTLNGSNPYGSLIQATDGLLYGMTSAGGKTGNGVLFSYNPVTGKDSILVNFNDTANGGDPSGSLIQASDGLLYGMTFLGGTYTDGVIFSYNTVTGKDSVLYNFDWTHGADPSGSLMQASNGLLYGLTKYGGDSTNLAYDVGVLFSFNTVTGQDSVLFQFDSISGNTPMGSLIQASNGLLYGMAYTGGINTYGGSNNGTVFSYNILTAKDSVLVKLTGLKNGDSPSGDLLQATDGQLYGMTWGGGTTGGGVLFRLNPVTQKDSVLLNFGASATQTLNSILTASNGLMYGLTYAGGTFDYGTLFNYNPTTGKDSVLINFNGTNGANPDGALIQASNGLLYGLTENGGAYNFGTLFSFNTVTGKANTLYSFNDTSGGNPYGSLIQASDGSLYGGTLSGGVNFSGVLFNYNLISSNYNDLFDFVLDPGISYSCGPDGSLIQAADGLLYGVQYEGGKDSSGMLFNFNISSGILDTLYNIPYSLGTYPQGNVLVDTLSHIVYATVGDDSNGSGYGKFFSYNMKTKTAKVLIKLNGVNGQNPTGLLL
ncbi:MAG TPA: choice-of-anchor tandem repeat GloVer-containing protein, partial [Bacteroidia bacterium]|nr:choice-of-anchor tandem repeat GloVer-containing protein [Bacteroidia bacterium]